MNDIPVKYNRRIVEFVERCKVYEPESVVTEINKRLAEAPIPDKVNLGRLLEEARRLHPDEIKKMDSRLDDALEYCNSQ
ncbi:MAG: hypothetical protein WCS89_01630 [Candidatus Paceibacterota bacterium]|jgi:hypothetical protein